MTNTRTHADGFKGEYPVYVDLSKLPPAKFPWLEADVDNAVDQGEDDIDVSDGAGEKEPMDDAGPDEPE